MRTNEPYMSRVIWMSRECYDTIRLDYTVVYCILEVFSVSLHWDCRCFCIVVGKGLAMYDVSITDCLVRLCRAISSARPCNGLYVRTTFAGRLGVRDSCLKLNASGELATLVAATSVRLETRSTAVIERGPSGPRGPAPGRLRRRQRPAPL